MSIVGYNKTSMELRRQSEHTQILRLPPPEMRRFILGKDEPIPTPLDARGLVDVNTLLAYVVDTLEPEYLLLLSGEVNIHHIYWERNRYINNERDGVNPEVFRNLPINQIIIPTEIHAWIHSITREPAVPSWEAMKHLMDSYYAGQELSRYAAQSIRLDRSRYIHEDRLKRGREWNLGSFLDTVEKVEKMPREFQLIDVDSLNLSSTEELHRIAKALGKVIGRNNRTRDIKRGLGSSSLQGANATLIV